MKRSLSDLDSVVARRVTTTRAYAPGTPSIWHRLFASALLVFALFLGYAPASQAQVAQLGTSTSLYQSTAGVTHSLGSVTVPAGNSRVLIVTASHAGYQDVVSVSFGGTPMTKAIERDDGSVAVDSVWSLALGSSASSTSGNVVAQFATPTISTPTPPRESFLAATSFTGVDQGVPISATNGTNNPGGSNLGSSLTLTSASGDLALDIFDGFRSTGPVTPSVVAGQTLLTSGSGAITGTSPGQAGYALSTKPGAAPNVTLGWTSNAEAMIHIAVNLKAAPLCPSTVVTNGNDAGAGSLRQIIADACVGSTITFQAGVSTVTLTSAELLINKNLTIDGGTNLVTVTRSTAGGTPNFRIFNVQSGNTVSMNALTVSNGNHPSQAGGIQNSGSLTLTNMHITGNRSPQSGGLQNDSVLSLSNSSVTNNVATNFAGGLGVAGSGTTTLANCTFTGNQGGSDTGAIGAGGTALSITNCTISGNTLVNVGGVGAGITLNFVPTTMRNTIVSGNTEGGGSERNIDGSLQAASAFNVLGTGPAGGLTNGTNNNQVGVSTALLGSLANYGGLTPTLPLLPGSVAINTGSSISAPANDQRAVARVGIVDVGAFESRGFSMALTSGNSQTAVVSTAFANPLIVTLTATAPIEPVQGGRVSFVPPGAGASAAITTSPATINAGGIASVSATANATVGSYNVVASSNGSTGTTFALQNRLASADLSITKTNGTTTSIPGGSTTYTITASNAGLDPVTGATVADTFPAVLTCTWTCVGAGGGTCPANGSGNINSSVNLPVSASVTFTASCAISPSATGSLANTATITSSITDPTPANNSATDTDTLTPQANVSITKTDGQTAVGAGTNTTYTITASNAGPSNAPGTTMADTFPVACTSVNWTCSGAGGGTCTASGSGNISDTVNLPSGGSVAFSATCAISTGATGTLSNTATAAVAGGITDPTPGDNSATDTNTISAFPTLAINDVSVSEGSGGTQTVNFIVTRTGTTASAVSFDFATADGTATAGIDYVTATGTGTIPSGGATASTTVSVTINGDAVFENTEEFFVNLTAPTNATIADNQGIGTITNDDTAPTLAIDDVSITEGNSGTSNLVFTVTRTGLTTLPASFTAVTANGTATAGSDYVALLAGSATIAAGGATGSTTLTATINGDNVVEANETFSVGLSAAVNASIATGTGTGTITNDDTAGVVLVQSGGSTNVTEGGATDSYTLVMTSEPTGNVSIALTPDAQVTAAISPVVFTSGNWNTPQTVTVTAVDDAIVEGPHTGTISHTVTSGDAVYNNFTVANVVANITDNDVPGATIVQSGGNTAVTEGGATDTYTMVLTSEPSGDVTVTPTGTQVSASPLSLIFTSINWNVAQTVTVTASDDNVVEGTHTGSITHAVTSSDSNYNNLSIAGVPTISITDNDSATVQFAPISVSQSEASTPMAFTVTLSNPVASGVTVTVNSTAGTATSPADFAAITAGTVTFPASSTTAQTVNVTIANDALDEDNENFTLTLSNPVATGTVTLGAASTATGTIEDDDALPVLSVANVSQAEGNAINTLNFTVNLSPISGRDVSFTRDTTDGTAVSAGPNADFVAIPAGVVTIPAGQNSVTIPVTINGDSTFEGDESFMLNLSAPSNATPTNLSATGTLLEDSLSSDLSITKTNGTTNVIRGGSTVYTITASNAGPSTATAATVTDTFAAALTCTWTCAGAGGGTCTASGNGNLNDTVNLPAGGSVTYTAICAISGTASGNLINVATITAPADNTDTNPANNSATDTDELISPATVSGNKTVGGTFVAGTPVVYTIVLNNTGASAQLDNPGDEFIDVLPPQLTLTSATALSGTAVANLATNTVTWNGSIATGGTVTITINATILPGAMGSISNRGTINFDADGNGSNESTASTDNPATPQADATTFSAQSASVPVPTMNAWGLMILALLMFGAYARHRRWANGLVR